MQVVRLEPRTFMNGCQGSWLGIVLLLLLRLGLPTAHAAKKGDLLLHLLCHLLWSIEIYKIRECFSQNGQRNKISLCYINFRSYLSIKEPPNIWETLDGNSQVSSHTGQTLTSIMSTWAPLSRHIWIMSRSPLWTARWSGLTFLWFTKLMWVSLL